jgi:Mal s 1 allergenic protein-like
MNAKRFARGASFLLLVSGCAGESGGAGGSRVEVDAAQSDATTDPGALVPDASMADAPRLDESAAEASMIDASMAEASMPDASMPDASMPDASMPDRGDRFDASDAPIDAGPPRHRLMVSEYPGRIMEISAEGKVVWEHTTPTLSVMFDVLANGNVFYPHGGPSTGAEEVDRNHAVVWSYKSAAQELLGGARLPNGNTLLGEGGPAVALELAPDKHVVRSIAVPTTFTTAHGQIRHIRRLDNGNVLAALEGEGAVREFNAAGATVWEYKGLQSVHDALRLPNGNTLIGGGQSKRVLEVTPQGLIAWEFNAADGPDLGLAWICSVQVLKSGNLFVTNWVGANGGPGVHAFEVTRAKRVVYRFDDHLLVKSATTAVALDD